MLVGRWRRALSDRRVDVVVTPFLTLGGQVCTELELEAERYAAFVERPLRLVIQEVAADMAEEVLTPTTAATSGPATTSAG